MTKIESDQQAGPLDALNADQSVSGSERILQIAIAMIMSDDPSYTAEEAVSDANNMMNPK